MASVKIPYPFQVCPDKDRPFLCHNVIENSQLCILIHAKMTMKEEHISETTESKLYDDVCAIIEDTRYRVAVYVNSEACRMNWHVGMRIKEDVLQNARAEYGKR